MVYSKYSSSISSKYFSIKSVKKFEFFMVMVMEISSQMEQLRAKIPLRTSFYGKRWVAPLDCHGLEAFFIFLNFRLSCINLGLPWLQFMTDFLKKYFLFYYLYIP